jgi:hypothetical protein
VALADGAGSSGGASALIYSNCKVKFADFVEVSDGPKEEIKENERLNCFWNSPRIVDFPFSLFEDPFKNVKKKLAAFNQKNQFPIFNELIKDFGTVPAFGMLIHKKLDPTLDLLSPRFNKNKQELLVLYSSGSLRITYSLLMQLTKVEQDGVFMHEAFRQLNWTGILQEQLTTLEIEVAVRHFMGRAFANDDFQSVSKKIRTLNKDYAELRASDPVEAMEYYHKLNILKMLEMTFGVEFDIEYQMLQIMFYDGPDKCWDSQTGNRVTCLTK